MKNIFNECKNLGKSQLSQFDVTQR